MSVPHDTVERVLGLLLTSEGCSLKPFISPATPGPSQYPLNWKIMGEHLLAPSHRVVMRLIEALGVRTTSVGRGSHTCTGMADALSFVI